MELAMTQYYFRLEALIIVFVICVILARVVEII